MTTEVPSPQYGNNKNVTVMVSHVVNYLEQIIQLHYPYTFIKSGLVVGDRASVVTGILICLDITEAALDEAIEQTCNLLITYQPLLLQPLDQITSDNYKGRCILKAIRNELSIYVFGSNLDHLGNGASHKMAHLIELKKMQPILPQKTKLYKLTTFVPSHVEKSLIMSLYQAGALLTASNLMRFVSSTAVNTNQVTHSILTRKVSLDSAKEKQLTFTLPIYNKEKVIQTLLQVHPYENVSYYLEQIESTVEDRGSGIVGLLSIPLPAKYFLKYTKTKLALPHLQHTSYRDQLIHTVALYAGEGSWLLETVMHKQIDAFITAGLQYEQFLEADGKILMVDIGYAATRLSIKKLIFALLSQEFHNIAILRCKTMTNPVYYIND